MELDELVQIIGDNTKSQKEFKIIRDAVDRYCSASNDGKPLVKRSSCWNCGLPKKYHQNGKVHYHCECGAVQQDDA